MTTMEPLQVQTVEHPTTGLHRIVWADTGEPIGQRTWRKSAPPCPTGLPTGTPTAPTSLLSALRDVAHIPGLPNPHVGWAGAKWTPRQREKLEAEATAPTGAQLRQWREALGLSQREAADLIGVSRGLLCEVERGVRLNPVTRQKVGSILRRELGTGEAPVA